MVSVSGLSFHTTEDSLRNAFKRFGQLLESKTFVNLFRVDVPFFDEFSLGYLMYRILSSCSKPRHG